MIHKYSIFKANIPNKEGRVYSLQALKEMMNTAQDGTIHVTSSEFEERLTSILATVIDMELKGDEVWATIKVIEGPGAESLNRLLCEGVLSVAAAWSCPDDKTIDRLDGTTEYQEIQLNSLFICKAKDRI